jgi:hypothetical protein
MSIVEDIKLYQNKYLYNLERWIEAAYRGWLSGTNLGDDGIWEDQEEEGKVRNTLSFKRKVLRPIP